MDPQETEARQILLHKMLTTLQGTADAGEQELQEALLTLFCPAEFPHAVEVEWEHVPGFSNCGRGDLVFSSSPMATYGSSHPPAKILVVEVKFINMVDSGKTARTKRNKARKKVSEQVSLSMLAWLRRHPEDQVYGCEYHNENFGLCMPRKVKGLPDVAVYLPH